MEIAIVTGQTATGKTEYAAHLASKISGELINADSRQVYKYLDIVSGKDLDVIKKIPIHLYDIVDPKDHFSSYEWASAATEKIKEIQIRGKTPIIVGGTYHYLSHLLYGIQTEGVKPDWDLRKELRNKPIGELQRTLKNYSSELFESLNQSDRNNPQRLIRKIEISKQNKFLGNRTELTFTNFFKDYEITFTGLRYKHKEDLKKALFERVKERLDGGAIDEVKELLQKGYHLHDPGLSANACLEIHRYLIGQISYEQLIDLWVTIEMQYAKRQYTFMKRDKNIRWIEV